MIFQEPMTSLNPVFTIGSQVAEAVRLHRDVTQAAARARATVTRDTVTGTPAARATTRPVDGRHHRRNGANRPRPMGKGA